VRGLCLFFATWDETLVALLGAKISPKLILHISVTIRDSPLLK